MTRRYQAFDARSRRPVDDDVAFDERGVIRDGYGMTVPLFLQDALQKAVRADARRRKVVERDPMGRVRSTFEEEEEEDDATTIDAELAMHKPGYRSSAAVNDAAAHAAYDEYVRGLTDSWRKRDEQPAGALPYDPVHEGQACTINGAPGTLQRRGDWRVCVPDNNRIDFAAASTTVPRMMDEASAQPIRDAAYLEMCSELTNAWRTK